MTTLPAIAVLLFSLQAVAAPEQAPPREELWIEGRLLVATEHLDDPNFRQSVVYIIRHGTDGAFGLIVNRRIASGPLDRLMESLGRDAADQNRQTIAIYDGGPVARETALLLHGDDYTRSETVRVGSGLALTPAEPALDDIARRDGPTSSLLILGHAGWAPGQLEQEIAEGAWTVVDADADFVLDPEVEDKWRRALAREGHDL